MWVHKIKFNIINNFISWWKRDENTIIMVGLLGHDRNAAHAQLAIAADTRCFRIGQFKRWQSTRNNRTYSLAVCILFSICCIKMEWMKNMEQINEQYDNWIMFWNVFCGWWRCNQLHALRSSLMTTQCGTIEICFQNCKNVGSAHSTAIASSELFAQPTHTHE